jgi:hypothetical protein
LTFPTTAPKLLPVIVRFVYKTGDPDAGETEFTIGPKDELYANAEDDVPTYPFVVMLITDPDT